jgi:hypothetical protein
VVKWKKLLRQLRMELQPLLKVLVAAVDPVRAARADVDPRDTVAQVSSIKHLLHV